MVATEATLGVPVMAPAVLKERPVGSVPAVRVKVTAPLPPEEVTGVNEAAGVPTVSVVLATASVVESPALLTVRLKAVLEVAAGTALSVAVMV